MPVRRGHVAPRTTLIETIIRKFDTDSKYTISIKLISFGAHCNAFEWSMWSTALMTRSMEIRVTAIFRSAFDSTIY